VAEDIANHIVYWLQLKAHQKNYLGHIRHWDNLKMAVDAENIWVKDFTAAQLEATDLKCVPFAQLFYCKDNLLFPKGSLLPACKLPSLLWTPIERALPVELAGFNHNFFGIAQQQMIQLVPAVQEQKATILLTDINLANDYIINAPAIRLQPLQWTLINNKEVLFVGEPLLPLNGKAYWQKEQFILPVGYIFEFAILEKIAAEKIDATGTNLIWWRDEHTYCLLTPNVLQSLSIASWRQTVNKLVANN
jgi:hypothetical protein